MNLRCLLLAAIGFLCLQGIVGQVPTVKVSDTPRGYLIGPGDVIAVKALGEKDFDVDALTVDEDGRVQIPYVEQPVVASCKTERELQLEVTKLWSRYLKSPQVNVRVTQRNSRPPVSVMGEVVKEAPFDLTRKTSLLEVLSAAGGPTAKNGGTVQLIRTRPPACAAPEVVDDWKKETGGLGISTRIYSLAAVVLGTGESNPEILPGDIISVPKAAPVYVTGEVKKAGELDLPAGGLPLTQAIAMANGNTSDAKKEVKVYRRKLGSTQPEILVANLDAIKKGTEKDLMLEPYDIVEVGKAKKSIGDILMQAFINLPNRVPIPIP